MATTKKTASQAEANRISQIGDFRARMGGPQELPSGLRVVVRNPGGLTAFIANGSIPNSLLTIVKGTLDSNLSKEEVIQNATALTKDLDSIGDMMELMNIVTQQVIKKPAVAHDPTEQDVERHNFLHPENPVTDPDELRDEENFLYTDEIEEEDKMFLFQWVTGGTRDLERFRQEHERNVALVSAEQGSANSPVADAGADKR
jgi:hypothetical protein